MSLSVERLNLVHVIDPRVDVHAKQRKEYGVMSSGNENTFKTFPSVNFSNSSLGFSCNPPNERVFVNRRIYLQMQFQLIFTGTSPAAGVPLLQVLGLPHSGVANLSTSACDAPRCQPISQCLTSAQIKLNTDTLTSNLSQYWRAFTRYHNSVSNQDGQVSYTPTMPDQSQQYSDLFGFARSPLRGYGDNVSQCPRGGYVNAVVIRNDSTGLAGDTAIINLTCMEPFYISPCLFGQHEEEQAFIGIQTIDINCTLGGRGTGAFGGLIASLWSHDGVSNPSVISSAIANVTGAAMQFNYITPDMTVQIPKSVNYSYYEPNYLATSSSTPIAAGAVFQGQMNTFQLKSIPNRVYVWVSERDQDMSMTKTDTYFGIQNVNITFENRDGLLANASQYDLYNMSVRNGCNLSWRQWTRDVGSVLCFSFGQDIALPPLQAAGLRGNFTFSLSLSAVNLSSSDKIPTLSVMVVNEGVMTISNGEIFRSVGVLSEEDILRAKEEAPVVYHPSSNVYGGSFWSDVASFFKRAGRTALNVAQPLVRTLAPEYIPVVEAADQLARSVGVGRKPKKALGGKALSRASMIDYLKKNQ